MSENISVDASNNYKKFGVATFRECAVIQNMLGVGRNDRFVSLETLLFLI